VWSSAARHKTGDGGKHDASTRAKKETGQKPNLTTQCLDQGWRRTLTMAQPEDHSQRPFIVGVDERPYSPETANRKYEEAVARQSGGDVPDGGSPTDLISMSAFAKPQPGQLPGGF